jgi:hypothetical protein
LLLYLPWSAEPEWDVHGRIVNDLALAPSRLVRFLLAVIA